MADHSHHDHPAQENKPVAFVTPLILGLVTVLVILLFVSIGDPKHHGQACCEGAEQCEHHGAEHHGAEATEGASHHEATAAPADGTHATHEAEEAKKMVPPAEETAAPVADTTHHEAHH